MPPFVSDNLSTAISPHNPNSVFPNAISAHSITVTASCHCSGCECRPVSYLCYCSSSLSPPALLWTLASISLSRWVSFAGLLHCRSHYAATAIATSSSSSSDDRKRRSLALALAHVAFCEWILNDRSANPPFASRARFAFVVRSLARFTLRRSVWFPLANICRGHPVADQTCCSQHNKSPHGRNVVPTAAAANAANNSQPTPKSTVNLLSQLVQG